MNKFWLLLVTLFFSACGGSGSGGSQALVDQGQAPEGQGQAPMPEAGEILQVQGEAGLEGFTLPDRINLVETN